MTIKYGVKDNNNMSKIVLILLIVITAICGFISLSGHEVDILAKSQLK